MHIFKSAALALPVILVSCASQPREWVVDFDGEETGILSLAVEEGSPSVSKTLAVTNSGGCQLDYAHEHWVTEGTWLAISPPSGFIPPGGNDELVLTFDGSLLGPGLYTGTLVLHGICHDTGKAAKNSPLQIAVNLMVKQKFAVLGTPSGHVAQDVVALTSVAATNPANAPGAREGHTVTSNGRETLVFGGFETSSATPLGDGGVYDDTTDTWTPVTPHPTARTWHTTQVVRFSTTPTFLVCGGLTASGPTASCMTYNLNGNWVSFAPLSVARARHSAVWSATYDILWGGNTPLGPTNTGEKYDFSSSSPTALSGAPSARYDHVAVWTGRKMIVWGGRSDETSYLKTGGRYDPATDTWASTNAQGAPSPRVTSGVWTGRELVVWGGSGADGELADGAMYNPDQNTWTEMAPGPLGPRAGHTVSWTGGRVVILGGSSGTTVHADGATYDPNTGSWGAIPALPEAKTRHAAAFSGERLVSFGGASSAGSPTGTGSVHH